MTVCCSEGQKERIQKAWLEIKIYGKAFLKATWGRFFLI